MFVQRIMCLFGALVLLCSASLVVANDDVSSAKRSESNNTGVSQISKQEIREKFKSFYTREWGQTQPCRETSLHKFGVCSNVLRNEGNAPFMLSRGPVEGGVSKVAVLFHGLSDSPFFMREIADILFDEGYTVIVPLLPGHGKRDATSDMSDWDLAERWQAHVAEVIALADEMGDELIVGGFSTGGALAVEHYLNSANNIDGLMLFSGALALSENAEGMSRIWGIKLLARIIDGTYQTHGPNPYKYPNVAGLAGLELMDIINAIREKIDEGSQIQVPLFVAHSKDDATTPISGVEHLLAHSNASNTFFVVDESYELCHADLVVNDKLLNAMNFNESMLTQQEDCAIPKSNPLFSTMAFMLRAFVN
ncbi:carboxylesterase [Alteromonas sp. V450]|uniref:alpha/beta hydrolase n=1 Tax=Alteromonas sp. V450 TaxID=1912139 RepID=UPI000A83A4DA|nr:alpha/beta fold hydrolase [Alteromonas sp. V450]